MKFLPTKSLAFTPRNRSLRSRFREDPETLTITQGPR